MKKMLINVLAIGALMFVFVMTMTCVDVYYYKKETAEKWNEMTRERREWFEMIIEEEQLTGLHVVTGYSDWKHPCDASITIYSDISEIYEVFKPTDLYKERFLKTVVGMDYLDYYEKYVRSLGMSKDVERRIEAQN